MPGVRSPIACTPSLNAAVLNSGRGSRPGLLELREDVLDRRHAELRVGELLRLERAQHGGRANQVADPDAGPRDDPLDDGVGLGMHG